MPSASRTQHKTIPNTALPYVTNTSPTSAAPQWVAGKNCMTSISGKLERRPGFASSLESTPVALARNETIKRTFLWVKWSGQHYAMYSTVDSSLQQSYVYKLAIGSDATAVKIFTSSSTEPFRYQTANDSIYFGNGTDMRKFRATSTADTTTYLWGIAAPTVAPSVSLGGTGITGTYYWCYTFWNENTGHESSPSPLSSKQTPSNQTATVTWTASADAQVTHVKLYRTTNAGSTATADMQLVIKQAIGTVSYGDAIADASLGTEFAPGENMNDPPPVSFVGCYSQGRIALFTGSTVWLTAYEESSKGVPEESVPGASLGILGGGNAWNWDRPVKAVAPTVDGFAIFTPLRIYGIQGDSLDTFRIYKILDNRGATSDCNVAAFGTDIAWLDTANQVWHSQTGEIGQDIRPSIAGIDQSQSSVCVHISGKIHHVYLLDGANGIIYPYDLDTRQWMTPWEVGASDSGIVSGETASGTVSLLLALNKTLVVKQGQGIYNDNGTEYAASATLGLVHISQTSELSERFDRSNPAWRGAVDWIELKTNTATAADVKVLNDDDPAKTSGVSLGSYARDPDDVKQGTAVMLKRYPCLPAMTAAGKSDTGRMTSVTINWAASSSNFELYYVDIAYHPVGQ